MSETKCNINIPEGNWDGPSVNGVVPINFGEEDKYGEWEIHGQYHPAIQTLTDIEIRTTGSFQMFDADEILTMLQI